MHLHQVWKTTPLMTREDNEEKDMNGVWTCGNYNGGKEGEAQREKERETKWGEERGKRKDTLTGVRVC